MAIFANPFFSIQGQAERIKNVGGTLNAAFNPFSKNKVQANVQNQQAKTVLTTLANHPYLTAAPFAVAANPAGALAVAGVGARQAGGVAANVAKYATSSPLNFVKTTAAAGVIAGGGAVLVPKLYDVTKKATEKAVPILTGEQPFTADALPAIGDTIGSALGFGAAGVVAGVVANEAYDYFTSESPENANAGSLPTSISAPAPASVPITRETQVIGKPATSRSIAKKKKQKKSAPASSVRVQVLNQNTFIGARQWS